MAGLAAAFCGVSGGFGANFLIGSIDPVLAGLSQSAAQIIDPLMKINAAVNFYFMFVSAFMIVILGTLVTEKIVEPRLKKYEGNAEKLPVGDITQQEKKGLKWAGIWLFIFVAGSCIYRHSRKWIVQKSGNRGYSPLAVLRWNNYRHSDFLFCAGTCFRYRYKINKERC